jgi:TM2 domain-containing membrane protein YozV
MPAICPHCGKESTEESPRFCSGCGARMDGRAPAGYPGYAAPVGYSGYSAPAGYAGYSTPSWKQKSPRLAGVCSVILPGLGQVYNGQPAKGFTVFILFSVFTLFPVFISSIVDLSFLMIPGLIVWFYGIYDAHRVAGRMNAGELPFLGTRPLHMVLFIVFAVVVIAVAVYLMYILFVEPLMSEFGSFGSFDTGDLNRMLGTNGIF